MPSIVPAMFWALRTHERMKMRVVARGARDDIRCPPGVTGRLLTRRADSRSDRGLARSGDEPTPARVASQRASDVFDRFVECWTVQTNSSEPRHRAARAAGMRAQIVVD